MEITLEAIISFIGLFIGGGSIGGFLFWRQTKRKAKAEAALAEAEAKLKDAEAKQKEAEAKQAEMVVMDNMREAYEKMFANVNHYLDDTKVKVDGLRAERDYYKQERDNLQAAVDKLTKMFYELKTDGERERAKLRVDIQQLRGQLKAVGPLTCAVTDCKLRQLVIISDDGEVKIKKPKKEKPAGTVVSGSPADAPEKPSDIEPLNHDEL